MMIKQFINSFIIFLKISVRIFFSFKNKSKLFFDLIDLVTYLDYFKYDLNKINK